MKDQEIIDRLFENQKVLHEIIENLIDSDQQDTEETNGVDDFLSSIIDESEAAFKNGDASFFKGMISAYARLAKKETNKIYLRRLVYRIFFAQKFLREIESSNSSKTSKRRSSSSSVGPKLK